MDFTLEFEKPVNELENQIKELKESRGQTGIDIGLEIDKLREKVNSLISEIYTNLSPWQRVHL